MQRRAKRGANPSDKRNVISELKSPESSARFWNINKRYNGTIQKVRMLGTLPIHLFQHSHTSRIAVMKSWSLNERGPNFMLGAL